MAEIRADAGLRHCISEMYYEQHYDHAGATRISFLYASGAQHTLALLAGSKPLNHHSSAPADMAGSFGMKNGAKLDEVFNAFTMERQSGLLLHYWP